ncbi:uncharacterized protein LY89DRAFT_632689 [Mollisia scopiformis]|uniref:Uncharacterized protein n=1 Tax=Mollisia scopiformis TaxID=149040 RepID=A0A132B2C8_MOLSC|nr:uncharacterized protein LY89DRAFT_632689 [Mollisia scopiformis]KUJ06555.1 hypothetical protein LY89DRAFT_632689 [Mollisia scopiformis]
MTAEDVSTDMREAIQYGLDNGRFAQNSEITLLESFGTQSEWKETVLQSHSLKAKLQEIIHTSTAAVTIRTFLIPWSVPNGHETSIGITATDMELLCNTMKIRPVFVRGLVETQHWIRLGNGLFVTKDENGKCLSIDIFYRYFNGRWLGRSFLYSKYEIQRNTITNIWVNAKPRATHILNPLIQNLGLPAACRYFRIHELVLPHCLEGLSSEGGHLRNGVLQEENGPHNLQPKAKSESLHRLSSALYSLKEYLCDLEELIGFLIKASRRIATVINNDKASEQLRNTDKLEQILSTTTKAGRWVGSFRDRINIRINLAFHLSTQADNDINLQISSATKAIAHEAQRDSSSMITIAAVTMFFLPGTFVSAIFSMTFFNFQQDGMGNQQFQVSEKWWYYLAVTIPLTVAVFAIWTIWQKWKFRNVLKDDEKTAFEIKNKF